MVLAVTAPIVNANYNVLSDQQYKMSDRSVIVHILAVNVVDVPESNIMPQPGMKYYQIIYQFENTGDTNNKGHIQPIFIDENEEQYADFDVTSENVRPHSTTAKNFIEKPVPINAVITKIIFIEGFESHTFELHPASEPTPTPSATPTSTPSATPTEDGYGWRDCLPLIPFALAGGVAGVGIVINRCGLIRR